MQTTHVPAAILLALAFGVVGAAPRQADAQVLTATGDISAQGAFTCELTLPGSVLGDPTLEPVGATLERDRMLMARRPGMLRKQIPLRIDPATATCSPADDTSSTPRRTPETTSSPSSASPSTA